MSDDATKAFEETFEGDVYVEYYKWELVPDPRPAWRAVWPEGGACWRVPLGPECGWCDAYWGVRFARRVLWPVKTLLNLLGVKV